MRILLVSYFFPPFDSAGAVRTGKLAAYLCRFGHDVRVVSARDQSVPSASLPVEIAGDRVIYTRWWGARRVVDLIQGRGHGRKGFRSGAAVGAQRSPGLLRTLLYFPDGQAGWFPFALRAAIRMTRDWTPDIIVASSSPVTSLIVARAIARRLGVPWVGDLRDLWVDNHAYAYPPWRRKFERRLEASVLGTASGLVTVSAPLARSLRRFGLPVEVVLNGFDSRDSRDSLIAQSRLPSDRHFHILYTGTVYSGYQDPTPLFEALARMGDIAADVRVTFIGSDPSVVMASAAHAGFDNVSVLPAVPRSEALRLQRSADLLLFLLWNDPSQPGVFTTKLFEYVGSHRPILAVGDAGSVAADLIRERSAGVIACDSHRIEAVLTEWIETWRREGRLPDTPADASVGLTREDQARVLESFLMGLVSHRAR